MWRHRAQTFARVSADMRPMCTRGQCRTYQPKLYRKFKLWKKVLWWCKVLNVLMKIVAVSIILRDHCSDITLTFTDEIHVKDKTGPALSLFMHTSSYYFMVFLMTVPLWAIPNNTPHMLACFSQMCWSLLSYTKHNKSALNKSNLHLYYTYYHPNNSSWKPWDTSYPSPSAAPWKWKQFQLQNFYFFIPQCFWIFNHALLI